MNIVPFVYRLVRAYRARFAVHYDQQYVLRPKQIEADRTKTLKDIAKLQANLLKATARQPIPKLTDQDSIVQICTLADTLPFVKGNRVQQYNLLELSPTFAEIVRQGTQNLLAEVGQAPVTDIVATPSWTHEGFADQSEVEIGHHYLTTTGSVGLSEAAAELVSQLLMEEPELLLQMLLLGFPPFGLPLQPSHFQLGRSNVIDMSNIQLIYKDGKYYLVFLARTTGEHAFDGQVIWKLVYDPAARTLRLVQSGMGTHTVPLVDPANFFVAPAVFSAAVETLVVRLEELAKLRKENPGLSIPQLLATNERLSRASILTVIGQRDTDLAALHRTLDRLDMLAFLPAFLRKYGTGATLKAPSAKPKDNE